MVGALRHALPDVAPTVLSKRAMLMLSRAIEDEIAARADAPILIGAFQHERFWRASEDRWRDLSVTATLAVALADMRRRHHHDRLWQVRIDPTTPIAREWAVLCDSPTFAACLAGVELPAAAERRFEAIWTTEPMVVREVARVAAEVAGDQDRVLDDTLRRLLRSPVVSTMDAMRATTSLTNRVVAYLDRRNSTW
jgi:DICT domain-containing protein